MIAGRVGDNAALLLFGCELRQGIISASKLKSSSPLKIFALKKNLIAGLGVHRSRGDYRCLMCHFCKSIGSCSNIIIANRK